MAFWGVEVKPGKPFTLKATEPSGTKRLHLSQATLGHGNGTNKTILQCNVGNKSPLFLCVLYPEKVDSCQLNLEFQEADEVIFSVLGPRSLHLTGYFLSRSSGFKLNDDESESYGEDVVDTDVDKESSDDYDYSDSFINDDDPSGRGSDVSSTDDDEVSIKKAAKTKNKKKKGKGRRLRKVYQISDSDSDETSARADDSSTGDALEIENSDNDLKVPIVNSSETQPSRVTRSKAKNSTLENGEPNTKREKTSEATTHTHKAQDKKLEDKPLDDVVDLSSARKDSGIPSKKKKKRKKEKSKSSAVVDTEGKHTPESLQKEKPSTGKENKSSSDVLPSQQNGDATLSKKKRKRDKGEEVTDVKKDTKKPVEPEISSKEVTIEEIKKGNLDGKSAVKGKKVSILYTGKLKENGKVIDSNMEEGPLRFRLGAIGEKVIEGLSIGVEGMRVGDKRRLIIPPSLGYSKGSKGGVPKNAWLVYEVEAVKVR